MKINGEKIYLLLENKQEINSINNLIEIDFSHPVFKGHFPEKPVLPGVIMCDIIRHQISDFLDKKMEIETARQIKFLKMITPSENNSYNIKISIINNQEQYNIKAIISQDDNTYFKLNAKYKRK